VASSDKDFEEDSDVPLHRHNRHTFISIFSSYLVMPFDTKYKPSWNARIVQQAQRYCPASREPFFVSASVDLTTFCCCACLTRDLLCVGLMYDENAIMRCFLEVGEEGRTNCQQ
jgi:hypothetical protein